MPQDNRKDIPDTMLEYMMVSLISHKIDILIIGGGRAGCIKARSFLKRGCRVYVLSKEFNEEFLKLRDENRIELILGSYSKDIIMDKHIVVIATNDIQLNARIKEDCQNVHKLYLDCRDFREGMVTVPAQDRAENLHFALQTRIGSPKTSVFLAGKLKSHINEYDSFASYICEIRHRLKGSIHFEDIMNFVNTEFFYEIYNKDKQDTVLKMYYGGDEYEF